MTFANLSPLANHLWQSTLFGAFAWLLTLALRKNRASVRYWIWLAASVKFLIPFSLLVSAGAQLGWRAAPVIAPSQLSFAMDEISQPFAATAPTVLPGAPATVQNPLTRHPGRALALRHRDWHRFLAAVVAAISFYPAHGHAA
ncbi:MAG: hypothetical protein ABSF25_18835 [Bryobacteraceae bacterium]|jgi:hypothetical protein